MKKSIIALVLVLCMIFLSSCSGGLAKGWETTRTGIPSVTNESSKILAQTKSSKIDKIVIASKVLKKDMAVNIYLPENYNSNQKYPVLYLLHGYSETQDAWIDGLGVVEKADKLIRENKIKPTDFRVYR